MTPKSTRRRGAKVISSLSVEQLADDWYRALRAKALSVHTIRSRQQSLRLFVDYLHGQDRSTRVAEITRRDVEEYMIALRQDYAANTSLLRFTALRAFFNWCVGEEELEYSPMARISAPKVVEKPPTLLSAEEVTAILKTCNGKTFNDRRDRAIFLLLIDTGMRLHEVTQLTLDAVDLDAQTLSIIGKGRRPRTPHFDVTAGAALAAYLRARTRYVNEHPRYADLRALWLGKRGGMGMTGIFQMVKRRAAQAGINDVHPHLFRHGFAHDWLAAGGREGALAIMAGWTPGSRMVHRYGAALAEKRAHEEHSRVSPANRLLRPNER